MTIASICAYTCAMRIGAAPNGASGSRQSQRPGDGGDDGHVTLSCIDSALHADPRDVAGRELGDAAFAEHVATCIDASPLDPPPRGAATVVAPPCLNERNGASR